jgi:hypothetical protein
MRFAADEGFNYARGDNRAAGCVLDLDAIDQS